ncbi:hypothetical protein [Thioclava sp. F28-4]|uniref:hypothetical protein n=1 Tax=Thioclava sp. F28-4 TaxID=1915315 RepID=UPI000997082C|nr:hypothetical protein [Thioclava sp. F28-4]OOY04591.1 hypothetical protein BMI87_10240 [Thioclava sp. F28-4]
MTDKRSDERRKLASLADALLDDLFATSDEDILKEVTEAGGDPSAISDQMRARFEETLLQARKERMKAARAGRRATQGVAESTNVVDISIARQALRHAFQQDGLSMAARNETESDLTDEEVLRKYDDLIRLGVIDPENGGDP